MSSYRSNYMPWNKSTLSSTYGSSKSDSTKSKYDPSSLSRPSSRLDTKIDSDTKSANNSTYRGNTLSYRDRSNSRSNDVYSSRNDITSRLKPTEKKLCPPVTYKSFTQPGTRSRDPSPCLEREKSDYRLYPRTYTRSTSKEPESHSKFGNISSRASSVSKEDLSSLTAKYSSSGRKSRLDTVDSAPKNELSSVRLRSVNRQSKDEAVTPSRFSSKEDLSSKYITSRFLPRNTIEKSYSSFGKANARTNSSIEDKRRSRDNLLVVLQTQNSIANSSVLKSPKEEKNVTLQKSITPKESSEDEDEEDISEEMETITVVTRGTSPTLPNQSSFPRNRRSEMARIIQKDTTRPKKKNFQLLIDKEIQSDRLDDTVRYSRFGSSSIATPWSSYLDLKYNTPRYTSSSSTSLSKNTTETNSNNNNVTQEPKSDESDSKIVNGVKNSISKISRKSSSSSTESINSLSRTNSSKSINQKLDKNKPTSNLFPKSNLKPSSSSSSLKQTTSELSTSKNHHTSIESSTTNSKNYLPPPVPKNESPTKIIPNSNNIVPNKDFRKSILNMNTDGKSIKKSSKYSSSSLSSDSESPSIATCTESQIKNLPSLSKSSSNSIPRIKSNSSISKLSQKSSNDLKTRRSSSISSESSNISTEEEKKLMKLNNKSENSSRTSVLLTSADELSTSIPFNSKLDSPKNEEEAKSFLMRALAPVTNFFRQRQQNGEDEDDQKKTFEKQDSGEEPWWLSDNPQVPEGIEIIPTGDSSNGKHIFKIRRNESGKVEWWLDSSEDSSKKSQKENNWLNNLQNEDSDYEDLNKSLGDRKSPEGLEMPSSGRLSPYDNVPTSDGLNGRNLKRPTLFISKHTNIDDILGTGSQIFSPIMDKIFTYQNYEPTNDNNCDKNDEFQDITHSANNNLLDDAALQLFKDGDYGSYLDLEASINEQQEEFDGFESSKKNSIVLRTQLSVRVHAIIEKLLTSTGRDLRRSLFSLKQVFQEDKDLVHEFVQNGGLSCLIKVGSEADQNYQNYILRALGQVMLYVDGMTGVMEHNETVQWLYNLISSKFRLVVKTALKLLLVFVEYSENNCLLMIKAVSIVDNSRNTPVWSNVMSLLKDFASSDTELLIYAMTLINKCLNGVPDQDTYYDQTDSLEEQGIEMVIQRFMSKPGTDLDLLQQFQIYEAVLQHEDGEDKTKSLRHLDDNIRKTLRYRSSMVDNSERRKSRRHSTGNTPSSINNNKLKYFSAQINDDEESSSSQSSEQNNLSLNGSYKQNNKSLEVGVTPALRRRRERAERQRSFIREQQEAADFLRVSNLDSSDTSEGSFGNNLQQSRSSSRKDFTPLMNVMNKLETNEDLKKKPWLLQMMMYQNGPNENCENLAESECKIIRENTVKDITQKLVNQSAFMSLEETPKVNIIGDMCGLINKAKEGLSKSKSKAELLIENLPKIEVKKSENDLRWETIESNIKNRPLLLCDLDFTDLKSDDEVDILAPVGNFTGVPPPPPPLGKNPLPPPPPMTAKKITKIPTAEPVKVNEPIKKNKKTVKLFWKEVREDPVVLNKLEKFGSGMIWDELLPVSVDTQKLEHLFESRAKDLISKKQQELNKNKEIIVLDHKRSNAINIGMTKLPAPRSIKTAILKMDATVINREGIEKLLQMLPTEEERTKIQEAQTLNPDLPLGSAEQFLLTLASISELSARLKLWAFKLDFENLEREIAEPLMDLKSGIELLQINKTFRRILSTLLAIGVFLNGNHVRGFQLEYLAKVPEVKDTVHKHSLLHHLCHFVMDQFPDATDLYSEIGAITRASKIDFDELAANIKKLEADCKSSWDHLKLISKHDDGSTNLKVKMADFLANCAERIILLRTVHRRVLNRYNKFLLWLGIPLNRVTDSKPNEFCRILSEFALEYRTTRERVLQQLEKKANHRERNKTRGKMITEVGKFVTSEDKADAELRQLLRHDYSSDVENFHGTSSLLRRTRRPLNSSATIEDPGTDDEILESLVKTATKSAANCKTAPRERKRTRNADRKSLRRTLKNGLTEEERKHIASFIKGF